LHLDPASDPESDGLARVVVHGTIDHIPLMLVLLALVRLTLALRRQQESLVDEGKSRFSQRAMGCTSTLHVQRLHELAVKTKIVVVDCVLYPIQSPEFYHTYIRWLLVLFVTPVAVACLDLFLDARTICLRRADQAHPCKLLVPNEKLNDLWASVSNNWLVVVLFHIGPTVFYFLKVLSHHFITYVMRVLENKRQAQKFKNNELDTSTLNISLNMLRQEPDENGKPRISLAYTTLIEEPLDQVILDPHVREKVISAAKKTSDKYAFLHTLAHESHYNRMMGFIINRISMEFNHDQLAYEADPMGKEVVLRRFWFGVCSEAAPPEVEFARKLRVFMASEQLLETLVALEDDENDATAPGGASRRGAAGNMHSAARFRGLLKRARSHKDLKQESAGLSAKIERLSERRDSISGRDEDPEVLIPSKLGRSTSEPSVDRANSNSGDVKEDDPFVKGFDKFYVAKQEFLKECSNSEKPNLYQKSVNDVRKDERCKEVEETLGFMPDTFQNGARSTPMNGLKRWQSIVEMAFIYADGRGNERGGGLLMPIDLPVPVRCSSVSDLAERGEAEASRQGSFSPRRPSFDHVQGALARANGTPHDLLRRSFSEKQRMKDASLQLPKSVVEP